MGRIRSHRITLWLTPAEHARLRDAARDDGVPACRLAEKAVAARLDARERRAWPRRWSTALKPASAAQGRLFEPPPPPVAPMAAAYTMPDAPDVGGEGGDVGEAVAPTSPDYSTLAADPRPVGPAHVDFREEWMEAMADCFRAAFFDGAFLPELPRVRFSCGFPKGSRGAGGQCWSAKCSGDKTYEIFIHPQFDRAEDVAHILLHECLHAAVGIECGHKGAFRRAARAVGFEGPLKSTVPGEALAERLNGFIRKCGAYPHAKLIAAEGAKKDGVRMLKLECPACGMVVRTTQKWIDLIGPPLCACNEHKSFEIAE